MHSNRTPSPQLPFVSPIRDPSHNKTNSNINQSQNYSTTDNITIITKKEQHQLELQRQAQHHHHLATLSSPDERRDFLRKQEELYAFDFLNALPDDINPIVNGHLKALRHMEMPTQAFSKVKPSTNFSVTSSTNNNNHKVKNNNNSNNHGSGLPMCHYPETREAILTLLGPESESGTFPSSLLSAALTTRLGVTVSNNVPERLVGLANSKTNPNDLKTKVAQGDKKISVKNNDDKAARNEFKKKILLARVAAAANSNSNFNNNSPLGKEFLDLSKEFEPNEDDDENEYVAINPDGTIKFDGDDDDDETDDRNANRDHHFSRDRKNTKKSSSAISLANLPSGADLEEFPPILREGIRSAAIEIMQRHLGPRMKFLVTRQRRLSIMGEEIDFSNGGIIFAKNRHRIEDDNNAKQKGSPAKRMNNNTLSRRSNNKNNNNNNSGFTTREEVKILAVSQMARNHSLSQVQQIVSDVMRRTCAPLQFLLPSSSAASSSSGTQLSPSFDPKFPSGIHFPACHELTSNSQLNQFLSATEKMHFSSSTGPFSPVSSFFANWSTEAMHSVINQGFLQIVPPGTQLCYQGSPVAVDKHSSAPSVYVILAGTCEVVFKSEDSVLPSGDARLYCGGDVFPPSLNSNNNSIRGLSQKQNQEQVSSKREDDGGDDINNDTNAGFGIFGASAQGKDLLFPLGAASMNRRKSFSMLGGLNNNNNENNNSGSDTTTSLSLNQKKQIGWETYFRSKGEYLVDESSSALVVASHHSSNHNNPATTSSLSAVSHQLYKIFTSSPNTMTQNSANEKTAAADLRAVENALFPLTSNKTQLMKSVVSVTPMLPNVGAAINVMPNNNNNNPTSKKSTSPSSSLEAANNNNTCFRNIIGPMTALGPFGISMTSATSGNHSLPHPCSLRTSAQTNTKCEVFVIPYWALLETMRKGNYLASASGEGKDEHHHNNNNSSVSLHGHKKHAANSVSPSDADQILFASACHQFSLIYFSTCCSRMLRKITWLLRPLSLNSSVIATATAAQQHQQIPGTSNRADGQYFFSKELRARIASAFRPILISQDKITQYRSSMAITNGGHSSTKDHGNINGGSSGAHNNNANTGNNNGSNNKTSGGLDPLAFLILPQIGSRARVQLTEAAHTAEASVVTVDALEPKTDTSKKMTTYAQVAQSKLRSENGVEFSSDSAFAFGLREVFVTAGRRIMESHRSLFKTKRRVKNAKGNSYDGEDDDDDDDDEDGRAKGKRNSEGSSSSSAVAHAGTFIAVSNANISRQEGVKIRAQSQLQGFLQQQQQHQNQHHTSSGTTPSSPALLGGSLNNSARDFSLLERRNSAIHIPSSHLTKHDEEDDVKVSGYVLCFVVCASELQKRILAYVTPNSSNNDDNNNFFPDVYFRRREEVKLLFQEADAKLVQYRTSAMATSAMRDEEQEEKLQLKKAQEAEKIKKEKLEAKRKLKEERQKKKQQERDEQDALHPSNHQNEATKKMQSKETASPNSKKKTLLSTDRNKTKSSKKEDEKKDSDSDSSASSSNSSSNNKIKNNKNRRSKSMILKKSVQELLVMALDKFPVVGPCCRLAHRDDILNIFSLLFEYKKYPPHSLVISKADLAADRIVVILKGRVVLNAVKESYHQRNNNNFNDVVENQQHDHEDNHNNNQWRFLTFAGSTTALPHRWNRSAVAITEVTTAEASRALVLPFLRDTGLFEAMKVFSEAVLSFPGIVSVPNFVVPDVVKTAMLCFGNSPLVHPILNTHNSGNSSASAGNATKPLHNVYGARSSISMNQTSNNNSSTSSSSPSRKQQQQQQQQQQSNFANFLPNFHSKQEVAQEKMLEQNEATRREQQIEKSKKTSLHPPLFGQERKNRDEWREYKRQQQLAKVAEEREQWEALNRKKERERKARENQQQQEGFIFGGNNDAGSLGSALNINKSQKHVAEVNSHSALPPIAGSKNDNNNSKNNQQKSGGVISRRENNQNNNKQQLGLADDVADELFGKLTAKKSEPPIDFVQRHKDSFTPHPTVDALELLRSRGVILKDDFFLRNSLDPMTKQKPSTSTAATASVHFRMEINTQQDPVDNQKNVINRRSASTPVPASNTTVNFLSDGGFFVGGCSTRKVIGKSHKSLAAGLWVKKRAPIQMPK